MRKCPRSVKLDAFQWTNGGDCGRSRPVEDESDLAEVIGGTEASDLNGILDIVFSLRHLLKFFNLFFRLFFEITLL